MVSVLELAIVALQESPVPAQEVGGLEESLSGLAWVDIVGLSLVGVLALLGIWRGLWWQVIRLVGLVAAIAVARVLSPRWVPRVESFLPEVDARIAHGVAWLSAFLLTLAVVAVLGFLGRKLLKAAKLDLMDRTGGLIAGAITGLVLHASLLAAATQLTPTDWTQDTLAGTMSEQLLHTLGRRFPVVMAQEAGENLGHLWESLEAGSDGGGSGTPVDKTEGR